LPRGWSRSGRGRLPGHRLPSPRGRLRGACGATRGASRSAGRCVARDLLHLLAEPFEALQSLLDVSLLGGFTDLDLELVDRGLQGFLAILDGALHLAAKIARDSTLGLPKRISAGAHRSADKAGFPRSR
jgi:hypothetical protein